MAFDSFEHPQGDSWPRSSMTVCVMATGRCQAGDMPSPLSQVLGESWSEPGAKGSVQGLLGHPRGLGPLGDSKRDLCRKELSCCILLICKHMLIISLGIG